MRASEALLATERRLKSPQEARWLLEKACETPLARLLSRGDEQLDEQRLLALEKLVTRRGAGEPLQHVLSSWPFRALEVHVDRRALVPRPETEVLVGLGLEILERHRCKTGGELLALDLGTGSGVIACSLVRESQAVRVLATDASSAALALAAENRALLEPSEAARLELASGAWYEAVPSELAGRVELVASNPPYLADSEWGGLDPVVRDYDPYEALVAGPTGLEAIEAVLGGARRFLAHGGSVVLELAPSQAEAAQGLARDAGATSTVVARDLANRPRVLVATW